AAIDHTVVQAKRPVAPEFDLERREAITRPVRRARHLREREFRRVFRDLALEGETRFYGAGLRRGPSADLTVLRARGEIGVCIRLADACHGPAYANLAANGLPVKTERRIG